MVNLTKCFKKGLIVCLVIVLFGLNSRINSQDKQHNDLNAKYNDLVSRLAINLPGGAYIVEPLEEKDKSNEIDIKQLFGSN